MCKAQPNFSVVTFQACVTDTVRAAKAQLQAREKLLQTLSERLRAQN